jgi:DNA-binding transcriptional MerR regulator/methylmalonyl-CoA mutase cobalamin-binding subunit
MDSQEPDEVPSPAVLHSIGVVSRRTGLSEHVLRAWELRYGAVEPARSAGGQRLYRDEDVARLRLLRRATELGHAIGRVATLSTAALTELLREEAAERAEAGRSGSGDDGHDEADAERVLEAAVSAARSLDPARLHRVLSHAIVSLRADVFIDLVAVPLLRRVGDWWSEGRMRPSEEHVVSGALARVLGWLMDQGEPAGDAPVVLLTTLEGERHELGAMLAAVLATTEGWRAVYLGPGLPPEEIAAAARTADATVVALSMIYLGGVPAAEQIAALCSALPRGVLLMVGGPASSPGTRAAPTGAMRLQDLQGLRLALRALHPARPGSPAEGSAP